MAFVSIQCEYHNHSYAKGLIKKKTNFTFEGFLYVESLVVREVGGVRPVYHIHDYSNQ